MRFLHVIPSLNPASGGLVEGLRQLCDISKLAGHECEVATLDSPEIARQYAFLAGTIVWGPGWGTFGYTPRAVPWLVANRDRFDAVIVHGVWQYNAPAVHRALSGTGIPYAVFAHGMLDPYFKRNYPLKHLKKTLYWRAMLHRVLNEAAGVLFTGEEEMMLARQSFSPYRINEMIVPLGTLGVQCDTAAAAAEEFLERWPELRGKRIVLYLGRIHEKKAIDLLIEAFASTLTKDAEWRLVIAGPDSVGLQKDLQELASRLRVGDRITWTGMLTGEQKWGAFAASELFALPSHQENFGFVFAEALSCGLPVILSDKVNIWREIESARAGIVDKDTVEGTKASLRRWRMLGKGEIADYRAHAKRCFNERFDLHATSEKVLKVFEALARKNPACLHREAEEQRNEQQAGTGSGF